MLRNQHLRHDVRQHQKKQWLAQQRHAERFFCDQKNFKILYFLILNAQHFP
jgi:hypothetical protein